MIPKGRKMTKENYYNIYDASDKKRKKEIPKTFDDQEENYDI